MSTHHRTGLVRPAPGRVGSRTGGSSVASLAAAAFVVAVASLTPRAGAAQGLTEILRDGEGDPQRVFSLIDKDGDGRVTRAELTERKMEVFFLRDADRDTQLSRAEFSTINRAAFDGADLDGNGQLSSFEFDQAPFVKFEAVDANGDGVITLEEFQAFRHRMN